MKNRVVNHVVDSRRIPQLHFQAKQRDRRVFLSNGGGGVIGSCGRPAGCREERSEFARNTPEIPEISLFWVKTVKIFRNLRNRWAFGRSFSVHTIHWAATPVTGHSSYSTLWHLCGARQPLTKSCLSLWLRSGIISH